MNIVFWKKYFLPLFFCAYLFLHAFGQAQQFNFRNYSVEDGLAQSQVYAICEDVNGNIWFGTRGGGLSRFDGINFINYTVEEGLPSNYIRTIIKDRHNNLWIGTDNGLSKFDGKKFLNYHSQQGLYNTMVNSVLEDKTGIIWVGTDNGIFQLINDTIVRFGRKINVPFEKTNALFQDQEGNVWAGMEIGLYKFQKGGEGWKKNYLTNRDGLPSNIITCIGDDSDGSVWLSTYGGGLVKLGPNGLEVIDKSRGLANNTVFSFLKGKANEIWVLTANGITRINNTDRSFLCTSYSETEGLANNVVMSGFKDSFGNLWFGTSGGGVSKLDNERFVHYTSIKGLFGKWVYTIFEDKEGKMWFGTSEGGVTSYDGYIYKRYSEKDGFTAAKIKCIHEDKNGLLWLGTVSDGLYTYDGKKFRRVDKVFRVNSNFINYVTSDTSGRMFIGTAGGGLCILTPERNGKFYSTLFRAKQGLRSDRINTISLDKQGWLWIGTLGEGLATIKFGIDSGKSSIINYKIKDFHSDNTIRCSAIDQNGNLYFGTSDAGVFIRAGSAFLRISTKHGLASNNVYSLTFDNDQHLWVGTEKGIDRVTFESGWSVREVKHYGKAEGFIGIETIQNSVCKDHAGRLWFGTLQGVTMYDPSKDRTFSRPKIHITGINLFFDKIERTVYGKNIAPWYPLPNQLKLPYDKNHLSFEYIGIEQANPESVKYKYKLDGFDQTWSPLTDRREAVYSNLPPGEYTFQVMACNETRQWDVRPALFHFTISPPFWKTWWFQLVALIIFILALWLMIYYSFKKVREENQRQRISLEMERNLMELEQKALRLQMNPHFLFNCLNSIKGLISEKKDEEAKIYLSKFAKLMRFILDSSMDLFISVEKEINGLMNYIELEKLSREDKFDFYVEVAPDIDVEFVKIPPMLIQPFVENAIIHGIGSKEGKGNVWVTMRRLNEYLLCEVRDDGIGREKALFMKGQSAQEHKSAAISVTQERLNLLNKKLNLKEVKINIIDLQTTEGQPEGTKVEIYIPYTES